MRETERDEKQRETEGMNETGNGGERRGGLKKRESKRTIAARGAMLASLDENPGRIPPERD